MNQLIKVSLAVAVSLFTLVTPVTAADPVGSCVTYAASSYSPNPINYGDTISATYHVVPHGGLQGQDIGFKITSPSGGEIFWLWFDGPGTPQFTVPTAGGAVTTNVNITENPNGSSYYLPLKIAKLTPGQYSFSLWVRLNDPWSKLTDRSGHVRCADLLVVKNTNGSDPIALGDVDTGLGKLPSDLGKLSNGLFGLALGLAGALAVLRVILGGFKVATSAGDPKALEEGRDMITSSLTGLVFILLAATILSIIGVDLLGIFTRQGGSITTP